MTDCTICCEKINKTNHSKVSCNYCELESCRRCVQKYLTEITTDAHCMQCKNIWNREFIDSACTKHFRNTNLKNHRENILFEREKCFLPDAQVIAAKRKENSNLINENNIKMAELRTQIYNLDRENEEIRLRRDDAGIMVERRKFVRKCPVPECRGFLSTQWKCELCDNKICHECNEIKTDEHECDPGAVETMTLLKKDTKACPNCGTMIFKISGCAQMWCPDCHTAFNWNTLQIEKGVIHNPHFFEFQRLGGSTNRANGDIPCGGLPSINELYKTCKINTRYTNTPLPVESKIFFDFLRMISHIDNIEIIRHNQPNNNLVEMRIKYLLNDMSEEEYKTILQRDEKAREKRRDINNILTMIVHTGSDILRQFVNAIMDTSQTTSVIANLIDYTNETLRIISKRYSCVVPQIKVLTFDIYRLRA